VVNIRPVSIQPSPARTRSASCCFLRMFKAAMHRSGKGNGASDVSALRVSRRMSRSPTRWSCSPTYSSAASRRPHGPHAPPTRRPGLRSRSGRPGAGQLARKAHNFGAAETQAVTRAASGFDKGTLAMANIGLTGAGRSQPDPPTSVRAIAPLSKSRRSVAAKLRADVTSPREILDVYCQG
jgi:hypothetical protein